MPRHPCPECGRVHLPKEEHLAEQRRFFTCADCGLPCFHDYMVRDEVWAAAGMKPKGGGLHLECLADRLGRPLTLSDFPQSLHVNDMIYYIINGGIKK